MADLHLVTGYKGSAHITSANQGALNAMSVGADDYVFTNGRKLEAEIVNNNLVRIYDGSLLMNGRYVTLDSGSYVDATITNGSQGTNRHDIIGVRYRKNTTSGIESVSLVVNIGTASSGTPTDPINPNSSSIVDGAIVHDMPLYRVVLEGLTIVRLEPLFQMLAPMADIQNGFYKQNMLINGDFQCNQRGEKTYGADGSVGYTVDMWRAYATKVTVLNEGVKLTGTSATGVGFLTQFIQLGELKTTTYTISAMVDDKICTFTVTPGGSSKEKDFGKFKISTLTTSTWDNDLNGYNNKLKVNICVKGINEITVKYVDVFEGEVAYPHVKEDPATALMRCRRYIQRNGCTVPPLACVSLDDDSGFHSQYRFHIFFDEMPKVPTLVKCDWYYLSLKDEENGSTFNVLGVSKYMLKIGIPVAFAMGENCFGFRVLYVISCEHNPTGD